MSTFITKRARELGLRQVDAKKPLVLEVTAIDVKLASKKNPSCCAFARACKRSSKKVRAAYFFRSTAWVEYDDLLVKYLLPPSVQKEIVSFDRSKSLESGTYRLSAPWPSATLAAVHERSGKRPGRHMPGNGKIQRKVKHMTTNVRSAFLPGA
jgi:hypothetical protein